MAAAQIQGDAAQQIKTVNCAMKTPIVIFCRMAALCILTAAAACAPLSKTQMEAVQELAFRSDTVSRSPAVLFRQMSEIRTERGLFYAASLSSGQMRYEEVTALAEASMDEESMVRKAEGYVDVLNSYVRALHSVSSPQRWKGAGTQLRGIASRVDSVLYRYNRLDTGYEDIPTGYAKMAGRVLAYVAEEVMQTTQAVAVRNIVIAADTLVAAGCDSLMDILRSEEMNALIEHEKESVGDNYSAYLRAMELSGIVVPLESDRQYVALVRRAEELSRIRNSCVSALRSLKNAHARLAADFVSGDKDISGELMDELVRFNRLASQVAGYID